MLQLGGPHHLGECSFSKWKPINCSLTYERNRVYVERKMLCLTFFRIRQISRVIEFYTQLQLRSTQSNVTHWVRPVNIYCGKKCLMHIFWRTHESVYRFFVDWKTFSFFSFIHLNADLSNHFFAFQIHWDFLPILVSFWKHFIQFPSLLLLHLPELILAYKSVDRSDGSFRFCLFRFYRIVCGVGKKSATELFSVLLLWCVTLTTNGFP